MYLPFINSTGRFNITNLTPNSTCFYKVKAACGAPSFRPDSQNLSRVDIEFIEFDSFRVNS